MKADRRTLLAAAATFPILAAASRPIPRRDMLIVNALGGLGDPNLAEKENATGAALPDTPREPLPARVLADARASGMDAVNITLGYVAGPMEPFEYTVREIGIWDWRVRRHPADLLKVLSAADILRARRERKIGLIYGVQNGAMLGDKADRVDLFADLGLRIVQLTYNPANRLGDGAIAAQNRGATPGLTDRCIGRAMNGIRVQPGAQLQPVLRGHLAGPLAREPASRHAARIVHRPVDL